MSELVLRPEDRTVLALGLKGAVGARVRTGGRPDVRGVLLFGKLMFLENCGLMKRLGRLQQGAPESLTAFVVFCLTPEGLAMLVGPTRPPDRTGPPIGIAPCEAPPLH